MRTVDCFLAISNIDVLTCPIFLVELLFAGVSESIDERRRQLGKIKDEKNKLKVAFSYL